MIHHERTTIFNGLVFGTMVMFHSQRLNRQRSPLPRSKLIVVRSLIFGVEMFYRDISFYVQCICLSLKSVIGDNLKILLHSELKL